MHCMCIYVASIERSIGNAIHFPTYPFYLHNYVLIVNIIILCVQPRVLLLLLAQHLTHEHVHALASYLGLRQVYTCMFSCVSWWVGHYYTYGSTYSRNGSYVPYMQYKMFKKYLSLQTCLEDLSDSILTAYKRKTHKNVPERQ